MFGKMQLIAGLVGRACDEVQKKAMTQLKRVTAHNQTLNEFRKRRALSN